MSKERFKMAVAIHLILLNEDKVLLLKRKNTGFKDGQYGLIAGHLEEGEGLVNCIIREAKEEVGLELNPDDLELISVSDAHFSDERLYLFFKTNWDGSEIKNMEPELCSEINWFSIHNLPDNTIEFIKEVILENTEDKLKFNEIRGE